MKELFERRPSVGESAIRHSQTLANLEAQLGVKLFDRSSRAPVLTSQGVALLAEARAVVSRMDCFKARAKGLSEGLEPEPSIDVDVIDRVARPLNYVSRDFDRERTLDT